MRLQADAVVDARFRRVSTKEVFTVSFLSFAEQQPTPGSSLHPIVIASRGPKTSRVSVGTIATEGRELAVREDDAVVDGKIVQGQGRLKNFVKCSLPSCASAALGCRVAGPGWLPCFCAWCGAGAVVCGALEALLP